MPRQLCWAQADKPARTPRAKGKKASKGAKAEPAPQTFTILERVPVRAHAPVWSALKKQATRAEIRDAEHPEEAFAADVIAIAKLAPETVAAIASALAESRALALGAEKHAPDSDVLAKRLDKLFEQELEWLAVRNLLAAALPRAGGRKPAGKRAKTGARALLLIDV